MEPDYLKKELDMIYWAYTTYGSGHATTATKRLLEKFEAETAKDWAELMQMRTDRQRSNLVTATRWAGHNVVEIEA